MQRPKPGHRLDTLIRLTDTVYLERQDDLSYVIYHGGFTNAGSPRQTGYCGSLREAALCAARYIAREELAGVQSLAEAEAKLEAAAFALLQAAALQRPRLEPAGADRL